MNTPGRAFRALGLPAYDGEAARRAIRKGLPAATLRILATSLKMPVREQSAIFGLSAATLTRKAGARTRLRPEPSDRVFRVAATLALAQDVLEDRDRAVSWLREPNRELHGERPLDLLDTEVGAREVERVLMRLEHGIYS